MTQEIMTVHKALCELKTLDDRIRKAIQTTEYVFANKHNNTKVSGLDIGNYCAEVKSAYQSATDLLAQRVHHRRGHRDEESRHPLPAASAQQAEKRQPHGPPEGR